MNIENIIAEKTGTIVDVRTVEEFRGGHAENSINIPLSEVGDKLQELKAMKQPLVLCCASGGRSGHATQFLRQHGIDCVNAGSWLEINFIQSKAI